MFGSVEAAEQLAKRLISRQYCIILAYTAVTRPLWLCRYAWAVCKSVLEQRSFVPA
jgi:hypothetical protein